MVGRTRLGIVAFARLSLALSCSCSVSLVTLGCGQGRGSDGSAEAAGAARAGLGVEGAALTAHVTRLPHSRPATRREPNTPTTSSSEPSSIGYRPAVKEHLAVGAPAVAVGPRGTVFLLDALNGRVMRMTRGEAVPAVENLPKDVDDLAIGPDGAIAVRRSVRPEVLVFTPDGRKVGSVDTGAVETTDTLALGPSRRVVIVSPFQETFFFGSPATPQLPEAVVANKREGAALLPSGDGVVAVRRDDGVVELRVVSNDPSVDQAARVVRATALGAASSIRVVGAQGNVVCTRIEHASQAATGEMLVDREAACVDVDSGKTLLRTKLPAVGTYVPRRELSFQGVTLAHVRPTDEGLELTTWSLETAQTSGSTSNVPSNVPSNEKGAAR